MPADNTRYVSRRNRRRSFFGLSQIAELPWIYASTGGLVQSEFLTGYQHRSYRGLYTGLEPPFPAYHLLQLSPRCGH